MGVRVERSCALEAVFLCWSEALAVFGQFVALFWLVPLRLEMKTERFVSVAGCCASSPMGMKGACSALSDLRRGGNGYEYAARFPLTSPKFAVLNVCLYLP